MNECMVVSGNALITVEGGKMNHDRWSHTTLIE